MSFKTLRTNLSPTRDGKIKHHGRQYFCLHSVICLVILLSCFSCSMRRFALEHHEFFSAQVASSYLNLDNKQKNQFRNEWRAFANRVTESKVEDIAQQIELLGETAAPESVIKSIQDKIATVMMDACAEFSPTMAQLKPKQIERLREAIAERNAKFDPEKHGGVAKHRARQRKDLHQTAENWLGGLNPDQKKLLSELEQEKDPDGKWELDYLSYSREAQEKFLQIIVHHKDDPASIHRKCSEFVSNPEKSLSDNSRGIKVKLESYRRKTLLAIFPTIDATQRQHLKREISKLTKDLRSWAQVVKQNSPSN